VVMRLLLDIYYGIQDRKGQRNPEWEQRVERHEQPTKPRAQFRSGDVL